MGRYLRPLPSCLSVVVVAMHVVAATATRQPTSLVSAVALVYLSTGHIRGYIESQF